VIPRIGVDLEPGVYVSRAVPELDLLDIAYGAAHGGAHVILVPISAFVASAADTPDRFDRPGLPLFAVKTEVGDLDRVVGLGAAPDRIIVVGRGIAWWLTRLRRPNRRVKPRHPIRKWVSSSKRKPRR